MQWRGVRRLSVRPSVCNFCANHFFSHTNGQIATKLSQDGLEVSLHPGCAQGQGQRLFTDMEHHHRCWPSDWTRDQCVTVAQLRTGHSPLLAACLYRIGCRDSATCPHCNGADETAEHLVLHCPAHDQAQRESWPNLHYQSDPRCLWSFLEKIGAVTRPPNRE